MIFWPLKLKKLGIFVGTVKYFTRVVYQQILYQYAEIFPFSEKELKKISFL